MVINYQKLIFETNEDQFYLNLETSDMTRRVIEEKSQQIMEWYNIQPHLPKNALDRRVLNRYLFCSKFSNETVKEKIDMRFSGKNMFPELFSNWDPYDFNLLNSFKCCQYICVPKLTEKNNRILIVRFTECDPKLFNSLMFFKFMYMVADLRTVFEVCDGEEIVVDFSNVKLAHILKTSPTLIKKTTFISQNLYAERIRGIHFVNCPSFAHTPINIAKSMMKKKLAERMHFYTGYDDLKKYLHPKYLPKDMGGHLPSCDQLLDNFKNAMQSVEWKELLLKLEERKCDESRRPVKSDDRLGDLLGITGSFRKLDID